MSKHDSNKPHDESEDEIPLTPSNNPINYELNEYEQQIQQLTEALQRERADSDNIRRRHEGQLSNIKEHVKASVITELLPVIDNFERSLKHMPKELEGNDYIKGIQGVVTQFEQIINKMGVEKIKTTGEVFNPELHEAVSMEDGDGNTEVVSEELQSGYILGENVLRHAMVRVKSEKR